MKCSMRLFLPWPVPSKNGSHANPFTVARVTGFDFATSVWFSILLHMTMWAEGTANRMQVAMKSHPTHCKARSQNLWVEYFMTSK